VKLALITGARGFIGRHLSLALHDQGYKVCGIGHGTWTESERCTWGVDYWLNGEISQRNLDIATAYVGKPDVVFHLAGGSSVGNSIAIPEEDFKRTVCSSSELLEWARLSAPDTKIILASSAAVYGAGHDSAIKETDFLSPYSPYGFNKRIAEELFASYSSNFNLRTHIVRLFSVYGSELKKQLLWDACFRLLKDPARLVLGGTGNELRDWLHVSDATDLLVEIAHHNENGQMIINGGTGVATSVRQIAEVLCEKWGEETVIEFTGERREGDPLNLVADIHLAESLGITPRIDWRDGLEEYIEWFKKLNSTVVF